VSLRDHYLEKVRAYRDSVERMDGKPIDADPARAALLLAVMEADKRQGRLLDSSMSHEGAAIYEARLAKEAEVERDSLLDALLLLKPPFPPDAEFNPYANRATADV
jgi:hypothetical protein